MRPEAEKTEFDVVVEVVEVGEPNTVTTTFQSAQACAPTAVGVRIHKTGASIELVVVDPFETPLHKRTYLIAGSEQDEMTFFGVGACRSAGMAE